MGKVDELFYILKADEDGKQFFYDKDLNKGYVFDYEYWRGESEQDCRCYCCYLFTKNEIEQIKKKIGDSNYMELDNINDEYPIGMYIIFTMKNDTWVNDIQYWYNNRSIGIEWYDDEDEDEDDVEFSDEFDEHCEEFEAYMENKHDGSYWDGELVRRALGNSRIYPEFIQAFINIYLKDFRQWWRENIKAQKSE